MYRVATRYSMNTYSIGDSPLGAAQLLSVIETRRIIVTVLTLPRTQTSLSPMKMCAQTVPFPWSLAVHHQSLASTLQKTKCLRRKLVLMCELKRSPIRYGFCAAAKAIRHIV